MINRRLFTFILVLIIIGIVYYILHKKREKYTVNPVTQGLITYIATVMDSDKNNKITQKEIEEGYDVLSRLGMYENFLKQIDFTQFDFNDDKVVSFEELKHFFKI